MRTFIYEFFIFGLKQAWACLFGVLLLALIIVTSFIDWSTLPVSQYDVLFVGAILIQVMLMVFKLETPAETKMIILFHIVATVMELFKTSPAIGAWAYPGEGIFFLGNVPLFAGFMYSAVGSYLARVWRIFDFQFNSYPPLWMTGVMAFLIYVNFFMHHFWYDLRYLLLAVVIFLFYRSWIYFRIDKVHRKMPLLVGFTLVAFFIWIAENIGTFTKVWLYPHQEAGWSLVGPEKMLAWFLLMIISFVMVSSVRQPKVVK